MISTSINFGAVCIKDSMDKNLKSLCALCLSASLRETKRAPHFLGVWRHAAAATVDIPGKDGGEWQEIKSLSPRS